MPGDLALPEFVEAGGIAGQGRFEVVANLAVESGAFAYQIAAVADEQLQRGPGLIARGFHEGAAGDRGAMDGSQVLVIGLITGINGLAVLLGDERMDDACLKTGTGEGALHDAVITAGAFDGDETVAELVLSKGSADLRNGGIEIGSCVRDYGGLDEQSPVKIGEEKLGADLGAIKADDAEPVGSDLLDARMEHTARFAY
jgi:hypothetical protein